VREIEFRGRGVGLDYMTINTGISINAIQIKEVYRNINSRKEGRRMRKLMHLL